MSTLTSLPLSGSSDGEPILVAATASPGTTIHTAANTSGVDNYDELWIFAVNMDTQDRPLTIQWGGTSEPKNSIQLTLAWQSGLFLVIPGLRISNSKVVKAFASAANVICISGWVNRSAA
jgi:hypothetical protein